MRAKRVGQAFQPAGEAGFPAGLVPGQHAGFGPGRWKAPLTGSLERLPYHAKP